MSWGPRWAHSWDLLCPLAEEGLTSPHSGLTRRPGQPHGLRPGVARHSVCEVALVASDRPRRECLQQGSGQTQPTQARFAVLLIVAVSGFDSRANLAPGDIWQCPKIPLMVTKWGVGVGAIGFQWVEPRNAGKHSTRTKRAHHGIESLGGNVNSEAEKFSSRSKEVTGTY